MALPFTLFPNGASGTYNNVFDLTLFSVYTPSFITSSGGSTAGAEAALISGLYAGTAYSNIHDSTFPGGEIRGFLTTAVPEPLTLSLFGSGLFGLIALRRREKKLA